MGSAVISDKEKTSGWKQLSEPYLAGIEVYSVVFIIHWYLCIRAVVQLMMPLVIGRLKYKSEIARPSF